MIDSDKIKVGQRVWFKNGDKIESGCITGWGQQAFGPIEFNIRKDPDQNGFAPTLEGWRACFLYETKLDCLRAILNANDTRVGYLASELSNYEKRSNELAAQIKAEEEKAQIPKAKIEYFRGDKSAPECVVKLPDLVDLDCGYDGTYTCLRARVSHILVRYSYRAHLANPHCCYIFACDEHGECYGEVAHKFITVDPRFENIIHHSDIRAAVKSLGFELED